MVPWVNPSLNLRHVRYFWYGPKAVPLKQIQVAACDVYFRDLIQVANLSVQEMPRRK